MDPRTNPSNLRHVFFRALACSFALMALAGCGGGGGVGDGGAGGGAGADGGAGGGGGGGAGGGGGSHGDGGDSGTSGRENGAPCLSDIECASGSCLDRVGGGKVCCAEASCDGETPACDVSGAACACTAGSCGDGICIAGSCCTPSCPAECRDETISDGCVGFCPANCATTCCGDECCDAGEDCHVETDACCAPNTLPSGMETKPVPACRYSDVEDDCGVVHPANCDPATRYCFDGSCLIKKPNGAACSPDIVNPYHHEECVSGSCLYNNSTSTNLCCAPSECGGTTPGCNAYGTDCGCIPGSCDPPQVCHGDSCCTPTCTNFCRAFPFGSDGCGGLCPANCNGFCCHGVCVGSASECNG